MLQIYSSRINFTVQDIFYCSQILSLFELVIFNTLSRLMLLYEVRNTTGTLICLTYACELRLRKRSKLTSDDTVLSVETIAVKHDLY